MYVTPSFDAAAFFSRFDAAERWSELFKNMFITYNFLLAEPGAVLYVSGIRLKGN